MSAPECSSSDIFVCFWKILGEICQREWNDEMIVINVAKWNIHCSSLTQRNEIHENVTNKKNFVFVAFLFK